MGRATVDVVGRVIQQLLGSRGSLGTPGGGRRQDGDAPGRRQDRPAIATCRTLHRVLSPCCWGWARASRRTQNVLVAVSSPSCWTFVVWAFHVRSANWHPLIPPSNTGELGSVRPGPADCAANHSVIRLYRIRASRIALRGAARRSATCEFGILGSSRRRRVYIAVAACDWPGAVSELNVPTPWPRACVLSATNGLACSSSWRADRASPPSYLSCSMARAGSRGDGETTASAALVRRVNRRQDHLH